MSQEYAYVTTPIYYVNDIPHIGHAYTTVLADVWARFKRLDGKQVLFLTGTDEHGQKIEKSAEKKGVSIKDFVDEKSKSFRDLFNAMDIKYDDFIRTTENRHKIAAQHLWKKLKDKGQIYLSKYAGWYAVRDEAFYQESEITDGKAPTGAPVEWVEEPCFFFKLSAWQQPLLKFYQDNPNFIQPKSRRNEVLRFVESGLQDIALSRTTFKWGIPVPDDPEHIMYVWFEALVNYLTALGYPEQTDKWAFWSESHHVMGKDILRFHALYWPAFLLAADMEPPKTVCIHGWWTNDGQKISKSLGNVINPYDLIEKYGLDQTRYFMLREVPFGNDGNFSHDAMVRRINTELANDFGNLAQRVLTQVQKNCDAKIPNVDVLQEQDNVLLNQADKCLDAVRQHIESMTFHKALESIWSVIANANRYIDSEAPWALKKTDFARMEAVLYTLCEVLRTLAIITQPFTPQAAIKLQDLLALPVDKRDFKAIGSEHRLQSGIALPKPSPLFPRFVDENTKGS
jgi:methionyl-tRNA synthetase